MNKNLVHISTIMKLIKTDLIKGGRTMNYNEEMETITITENREGFSLEHKIHIAEDKAIYIYDAGPFDKPVIIESPTEGDLSKLIELLENHAESLMSYNASEYGCTMELDSTYSEEGSCYGCESIRDCNRYYDDLETVYEYLDISTRKDVYCEHCDPYLGCRDCVHALRFENGTWKRIETCPLIDTPIEKIVSKYFEDMEL